MCLLSSLYVLGRPAAASEATAAPPESAFNFFYERAIAAYQAGRYAAAIEDLLVAYKMQPEPRLLFNIAQSHRKMGDARQAKQFFTRYLATDKEISAEMKEEIERSIAELDAEVAARSASAANPLPPANVKPPSPGPALVQAQAPQSVHKMPRWPKVLGSLLIVGGAGVMISGITFLALDGQCTEPPVPPAIECGRVYQLLIPGAAQTAVGGGLLLAGTLTLVIPYAVSARARSSSK